MLPTIKSLEVAIDWQFCVIIHTSLSEKKTFHRHLDNSFPEQLASVNKELRVNLQGCFVLLSVLPL